MSRFRTHASILVLLLAPALAASSRAARPTGQEPGSEAAHEADRIGVADPDADTIDETQVPWLARLVANTELSFTSRSSELARLDLGHPDLDDPARAVALMGLGCSEAWPDRARLESFAVEGESLVRVAAILALGELGATAGGVVEPLIEDPDPRVGESALLALLRAGNPAPARAVAADEDHPLAHAAAALIVLVEDPTASSPTDTGGRLLELRLLAARRYGLVQGQAWRVLLLADLAENEAFLDRLVFLGAAELQSPAVRDHFLELLLSGPREGANGNLDSLRGAVIAIPAELAALVDYGLWKPKGGRAWNALISEIDRQFLEVLTDAVLRTAWAAAPGLRSRAALLITRGGSTEGLATVELALDSEGPAAKLRAMEVLGGTGISLYVKTLSELLDSRSTKLASAALVAQLRLGFDEADSRLRSYFRNQRTLADAAAERGDYDELEGYGDQLILNAYGRDLITAMCRTVRDPLIRELLLEIFPRLGGGARLQVATALAEIGRPETRGVLRDHLRATPPEGAIGAAQVHALAHSMSLEELSLVRELFPVENDFEVNAELALALVGARDPAVLPLLRAALWREPMERSLLAAALIADVAGLAALREELQHPSLEASARDLRRVGFALGELGGVTQVEILSKRLSSGDAALQGALLGALAGRTH